MTLQEFISANRNELVARISRIGGWNHSEIDDDEIRLWIANNEGLYQTARIAGVDMGE